MLRLLYSVIYSFDCPKNERVNRFNPPIKQRKKGKWELTEGDEQRDLSYLGGDWEKCKHRKWCAVLNREEFEEFVNFCELRAEDVETMGSIGAPGFELGWAPAISFNIETVHYVYGNAYVTPFPNLNPDKTKRRLTEVDWRRVCRAVFQLGNK